jgi:hypothetical protein
VFIVMAKFVMFVLINILQGPLELIFSFLNIFKDRKIPIQ